MVTNGTRCVPYHSVKGRRGTEELMPMSLSLVHQAHEGRASDTKPACASFHHHRAASHDGREKRRRQRERGRREAVSPPTFHAKRPCAAPTPGSEKHGLARCSSLMSRGWRTASPTTFLPVFSSKEGLVPRSPSQLFPPNQEPHPSTSRE